MLGWRRERWLTSSRSTLRSICVWLVWGVGRVGGCLGGVCVFDQNQPPPSLFPHLVPAFDELDRHQLAGDRVAGQLGDAKVAGPYVLDLGGGREGGKSELWWFGRASGREREEKGEGKEGTALSPQQHTHTAHTEVETWGRRTPSARVPALRVWEAVGRAAAKNGRARGPMVDPSFLQRARRRPLPPCARSTSLCPATPSQSAQHRVPRGRVAANAGVAGAARGTPRGTREQTRQTESAPWGGGRVAPSASLRHG